VAAGLRLPEQWQDCSCLMCGEWNQRKDILLSPEESLVSCATTKDGIKHGYAQQTVNHHSLHDSNRNDSFSSNASSCVAQCFLYGGGKLGM